MRERMITIPELGLIAGTRAALGAGLGLLLADRLTPERRRAVGWTLLAVGTLTTFPLAAEIFLRGRESDQRPGISPSLSRSRAEEPAPAV